MTDVKDSVGSVARIRKGMERVLKALENDDTVGKHEVVEITGALFAMLFETMEKDGRIIESLTTLNLALSQRATSDEVMTVTIQ
jgi:hypothetical protein